MTSMGSDPNRFPRVFLLGVNQEALNSPAYLQELVRLLSQSSSDEESGTQTVCTNAVANENCDLTESFKKSMIAENGGLYPREFYGLKVSFIIAESSRR